MRAIYQREKVFVGKTIRSKQLLPKSFKALPFEKIKENILGKRYDLSIIVIGRQFSKSLNQAFRKKNQPTDVLSFSLSPLLGEIFITPSIAKIKSAEFSLTFENYLLFLVIHAILHLKGMVHGSKMEKYERAYYSRYRRRYL